MASPNRDFGGVLNKKPSVFKLDEVDVTFENENNDFVAVVVAREFVVDPNVKPELVLFESPNILHGTVLSLISTYVSEAQDSKMKTHRTRKLLAKGIHKRNKVRMKSVGADRSPCVSPPTSV